MEEIPSKTNKNIKKLSKKCEGKCTPCKSEIRPLRYLHAQHTDIHCGKVKHELRV